MMSFINDGISSPPDSACQLESSSILSWSLSIHASSLSHKRTPKWSSLHPSENFLFWLFLLFCERLEFALLMTRETDCTEATTFHSLRLEFPNGIITKTVRSFAMESFNFA
ncbi:hypothetical protein CEXT_105901 [Caerostris extrusa]|uniref:Uncharacterized protein n=1 Tax=Caerostris extrusa TaxID=172846 RepID=A0AAV4UMN6_CAEEX|nr:hypothetical protein CEXT_105901 [Caerostris extrusa]